ncbi:MAG: YigZ family protein [Bacillota bacterium]|nr:YigZ family protein [Bacillota bacterium]
MSGQGLEPGRGAGGRLVLAGPAEAAIEVKRSRFVAAVAPAATPAEARAFWLERRRHLPDARHHAVAWRVEEEGRPAEHASDDGEPGGTAGRPALAALRQHGLERVVLVISRHFGGILLGAPGLVRAYRRAAEEALAAAPVRLLLPRPAYALEAAYPVWDRLVALAERAGARLEAPVYEEVVRATLLLPPEGGEALLRHLRELGPTPPRLQPLGERWCPAPASFSPSSSQPAGPPTKSG